MKLIKTSFYAGIITFIKIASGFIAAKFIAKTTGPPGVALLGQFTSFLAIVLTFSNGAISNGIVKYTAEFENSPNKLKVLFSTALKISIIISVLIGSIFLIFSNFISKYVLYSYQFSNVIKVLGLTLVFYSINLLLISILNGLKQIKIFTIANATAAVFSLILTIILVHFYKIEGALYALVVTQTFSFVLTILLIKKVQWFSFDYFNSRFDKELMRKLAGYGLISLVSAITMPLAQMKFRDIIIDNLGIDAAGYWQGLMRISDGYLLLINTSISIYYLPKLASLKTDEEIRSEIFNGFKLILPVTLIGCILIYFCRFLIIRTLYSESFLEMENLFFFQLLGDLVKVASMMIGYLLIAKSMVKTAIFTEALFSVIWVGSGYFGLEGSTISFFITYTIYFIIVVFIFKKIIFLKKQ